MELSQGHGFTEEIKMGPGGQRGFSGVRGGEAGSSRCLRGCKGLEKSQTHCKDPGQIDLRRVRGPGEWKRESGHPKLSER